jgi:transketolase
VTNLIAIVDRNHLQINGMVEEIMDIEPLSDKWLAFGWKVLKVDGHDMKSVLNVLDEARGMQGPVVILGETVKGKGVSFMENVAIWHGQAPTKEQAEQAQKELYQEEFYNEEPVREGAQR